jgi:hypothetical protein
MTELSCICALKCRQSPIVKLTELTIGSVLKQLHNAKRGGFSAYSENGQLTTTDKESDDEILLRDVPRRHSLGANHNDRGITVQVNIDVDS